MKYTVKCKNCKKDIEIEKDTVMVVCGCGHTTEVDIKVKGGDYDE